MWKVSVLQHTQPKKQAPDPAQTLVNTGLFGNVETVDTVDSPIGKGAIPCQTPNAGCG